MTDEEYANVPKWKKRRLLQRIMNYGKACFICGESLTLAERVVGKTACADCWPEEIMDKLNDERGVEHTP